MALGRVRERFRRCERVRFRVRRFRRLGISLGRTSEIPPRTPPSLTLRGGNLRRKVYWRPVLVGGSIFLFLIDRLGQVALGGIGKRLLLRPYPFCLPRFSLRPK